MRKKIVSISLACILLLTAFLASFLPFTTAEASNLPLRRVISNTNPLFIYNLYGGQGPQNVQAFWNALPNDLKAYFGIQIVPSTDDSQQTRAWITNMLAAAQQNGIPLFIQTESCNTRSNIPLSFYSGLFDQYSVLTGLVFAEMTASVTGLDTDRINRMKANIDTVVSKGGYFMWQDMGDWKTHVFLKAGADSGLFDKIKQNKDHIILVEKHNGDNKRFVGPSTAMGYWTADLISNWGVNSEDWLWWEGGYGPLYAENRGQKGYEDWKSVFSFPDAQYGTDWLQEMAGGATVYSLECPYHGFTAMESDLLTPAFEKVLIPLIRKMVNDNLIPAKEQVMSKIKVAHHAQIAKPGELENDEYFKDLYGPEVSSLSEWMPSTGRYYAIPVLPPLSGPSELNKFHSITTTNNYEGLMFDHYDKIKRFNQDYETIGRGDSWFVNFGGKWFLANPYENKNITTTFEFPLATNSLASLAGSISPHTFGIVQENPEGMNIHLSNYRIDSNADIWNNPNFNSNDIAGYVRNKYIANPTDDALRQSVIILKGATSAEPSITVTGDNGYNYTALWNDSLKEYTITVNHNGPVDIVVNTPLTGPGTTNRNIAAFAKVTASSRENDQQYLDEKAIDGISYTRWNANANDKVGSWMELSFDTNITADKVVLKEFLDRVTGYKLQYWDGISWADILTDTTIGSCKVNTFAPVTTNRLRFYVTATKTDSNGWGAEPSLYEFEVYNTAAPAAVPKAGVNIALNKTATASSYFDNDPGRAPSKAIDNSSMTAWNAGRGTTSGQWLEVDLGQPAVFNKVITKSMLDRITGYKLQYWNGTAWADITYGTRTYPQKCDTFSPVTAQKVRIYITSTKTDQKGWGADAEIEEFGVYYDASLTAIPQNLALNKTAAASSNWNNDASRPAMGIDADLKTSWNAARNTSAGQWLEVNLGSTETFNRIDLSAYLDRVTGYKLQYLNGTSWVDIVTGSAITPWRNHAFNAVSAQKVRIFITSTKVDQNGWGADPEIDEFAVYNQ